MTKLLDHEAKTFGDYAYLAISKHYQKILKHEENVLKDEDPEELHQMRVGMRRLRSAIVGFSTALDLPKNAKEKKVGKGAKILGNLRDLDVLEDALKTHYQPILSKAEEPHLEEVFRVLTKERKKAFKGVQYILNHKTYLGLKEGFENWLENPTYQKIAEVAIETILPDLLLPQISQLMLHPGWLVGVNLTDGNVNFTEEWPKEAVKTLLENEGESLHELRKEAKRSRYNMELFTEFYQDGYQLYLKDIKDIQTILGDIQDCFVLAQFLSDIFAEDLTEIMPTLARKFQEIRWQKWQEWQHFQHKFLNPQTRQDLHLTILHPKPPQ